MVNDNTKKSDEQKQVSYIKEQGSLHEIAAQKAVGGDAVNLNDFHTDYPTYDITSSTEISSVKSHMRSGTGLTNQDVNAYVGDFHHMLGWGRSQDAIEQDAKNIMDVRDKHGGPVPKELKDASQKEVVEYLKHNSSLRIPDDHVETVQQALEWRVRSLPENYFLGPNPTEEEVKSVVDRVKGTGLDSSQTLDQLVDGEATQSESIHEAEGGQAPNDTNGIQDHEKSSSGIGEAVDNHARQVQSGAVESVGQSMDVPKESAAEGSSQEDHGSDEEQNYGYGY